MTFTSIESVESYLEQIPKFQSTGASSADFDLARFSEFCASIGHPEQQFPSVHVAGTNGKGSTCSILGTVLRKSGYKVGVYTSPHILNFNERFRIGGECIPDEQLVEFFRIYSDEIEEHELTYFEISTAIAFWWFARSEIDIAVIEVGLGGRLDATNVIDPEVSVITSISLDHTDILGDSIEEIAREKGGIIKSGCPVVVGDLAESARQEIFNIAEQKGARWHTIDELNPQFVEPGHYQLTVEKGPIDLKTNLAIPVQAKNIAMAWQVIHQLQKDFPVSQKQFISALKHVDLGFGRFEKLVESQPWYFDGGHNVEAVKALKASVNSIASLENATLVLSMMKDKLRPNVMDEFSEFKNIYYYPLGLERAASFNDINYWLPQVNPFPEDQRQSFFLNDYDSELVIFAGSFYFYETVRDWVSSIALNH